MKKLLLCLVALFAAIGAQASTQTISKGEGTSGTSTVKFSATDKDDITAKAVYTLTLNADNKLEVELTFADLNNSDVLGLANDPCYMFIDGIGETSLSYADGKYTGTTVGAATPGNFYSNCYFKRTCANIDTNYGENGQLIFPFEFTAPSAAAESEISGVVSDITATTATLTLTCKPAEGKTVKEIVVSGLGVGKDITFTSTDNLTANLKDLTPGTKYDLTFTLTCTDNSTTTSTVSFTTLSDSSSDKEVKMEFIEVNVSDLSALFKLKVDLSDNNQSKEYIHMYLRKANETPEATPDDPYAIYGEDKGTPAVDMRDGIENPIYFNYTELEKNTKYVATAVVKKDGYTGIATKEFETLGEANGTTSYIENGYFRDGKVTTSDDGQELKITYLATARYTFTYDKDNKTLYLTFDTRIRNNPDLPDLQAKYILYVEGNGTYYGAPLTNAAGFKDHYSFIINNHCPDIAKYIANGDKMTFTYFTDYAEGGQSFFGGVQYDGTTSSVDFGEPADIQWINYTYDQQKPENENKNRYDLYKKAPKTQLMASVVDKDGHYLPRRLVKFEMAAEHADKADVTYDLFDEQPKWFVTAKEQPANTHVDFEVVAYHELETEAAPAGAPRRVLNADKNRLEAKRGFHYVESETPTGIDDIEADDANAPVRYFDLNGREISEPQKGMFVIRLQGSKATKMIAE